MTLSTRGGRASPHLRPGPVGAGLVPALSRPEVGLHPYPQTSPCRTLTSLHVGVRSLAAITLSPNASSPLAGRHAVTASQEEHSSAGLPCEGVPEGANLPRLPDPQQFDGDSTSHLKQETPGKIQ